MQPSTLQQLLQHVASDHPAVRFEPYGRDHPQHKRLTVEGPAALRRALAARAAAYTVRGSAGMRAWAHVPWLGVFDPAVTNSATLGVYVVYLFAADGAAVYLGLIHGTVALRREHGAAMRAILARRRAQLRRLAPAYATRFPRTAIDLASSAQLPRDYEAGFAFGVRYDPAELPDEAALQADLNDLVDLYAEVVARGGLSAGALALDEPGTQPGLFD